ncbi:hypothetical protein [Thalassospira xiamenensis]|uniref:Uncharacterized protein n=1 Tax=Thalassospira xiamenensis TaxID=220697 RepID=A0A285TRP5_9PROT|nr:hypothetical protein [Thalassospira xiamenensis]SOC26330.1 hypothetical protein SAMN05428964_10598 [Thalassospira xiamenensis]
MREFNDVIITEDFPDGWQVEDRLDSGKTLLVKVTSKAFPQKTCYCLRPRTTSTEDWLPTARMIARGMEVEFAKQAEAHKAFIKSIEYKDPHDESYGKTDPGYS